MPPRRKEPLLRFVKFWNKDDTSGCWIWKGGKSDGYGYFWDGDKTIPAHRWSYEEFIGAIPEDLELDHLCRNRACVYPPHLEPVTHEENVRRGESGQHNAEKTHCPHGHRYDEKNTYIHPRKGGRYCRTCNRERARRLWKAA